VRYRLEDFQALQAELRGLLIEQVGREQSTRGVRVQLRRPPGLWLIDIVPGRPVLVVSDVSVRDAVLFQAMVLLGSPESTRIRRCPEAVCGHRLFYKIKRREYCSVTCQERHKKRAQREAREVAKFKAESEPKPARPPRRRVRPTRRFLK
jgi:hypothetical protein